MSEPKDYYVRVPIAGSICVYVKDAATEDEAIEKAMNADWNIDFTSENNAVELDELEPLKKIVEGNVCYAPFWYVDAQEV